MLRQIHPRSLADLTRYLEHLVAGRLRLNVLIAMSLGIGVGLLLGPSVGWIDPGWATLIGEWLALPGQLFLGSIQMIVVPLVFASMIRGLAAGEDVEQLRRLGVLASVLRSAGIPVEAIALIIGVDRILDMSRTAVNVTGDLTACVVMDRWVGGPRTALQESSAQSESEDEVSAGTQPCASAHAALRISPRSS